MIKFRSQKTFYEFVNIDIAAQDICCSDNFSITVLISDRPNWEC